MKRKCAVCKSPAIRITPAGKGWCGGEDCGVVLAAKAREKQAAANNRAHRLKKKSTKPRRKLLSEAQAAFNWFIRERDHDSPCICCDSFGNGEDWQVGGKWDAGHFLSRGAFPELRFEPDNCHKQLKSCNAGSSKYARKGRTVAKGYRKRLIAKIGLERVLWLEGPHETARYTVEELEAIKTKYNAAARRLMREREAR